LFPNNDAFAALPADVAEKLSGCSVQTPARGSSVFHVLGRFLAADLSSLWLLFLGPRLVVIGVTALTKSVLLAFPLRVQGNKILWMATTLSNGVVHVIDGVLTPTWVFTSLADRAADFRGVE
jgi:uncharacterized surface protein with fasciclin (FAS1) repeats